MFHHQDKNHFPDWSFIKWEQTRNCLNSYHMSHDQNRAEIKQNGNDSRSENIMTDM